MSLCRQNDGHFAPLMGYCDHRVHTLMESRLRPYNISPAQCRTLVYLHEAPAPVNHRALERFLMVKPSTVNGIVCRLEEKGLILRSADEKDGRCKQLALTERGHEFYDTFCTVVQEVTDRMEQNMTREELDTLSALLRRVAQNLSEEGDGCLC